MHPLSTKTDMIDCFNAGELVLELNQFGTRYTSKYLPQLFTKIFASR